MMETTYFCVVFDLRHPIDFFWVLVVKVPFTFFQPAPHVTSIFFLELFGHIV